MTAGRRLLLAILQIVPTREVALRVHVSIRSVSHWRGGMRKPSRKTRVLLERHCQIPSEMWDRQAKAPK